jgi:heavy metal sensor kinase
LSRKTSRISSVALKIAVSYAAAFAVVAAAAFGILYIGLSSNLEARLDDFLKKQGSDLELLYESGNRPLFTEEINRQTRYEGVDRMFVLIMDSKTTPVLNTDMNPWKGVATTLSGKIAGMKNEEGFITLKVSERRNKVRVIIRRLKDGSFIATGRTIRDNDEVMEDFREIFSLAFSIILLIGALAAWFVAKRAMRGVERVTKTAGIIGTEGLSSRVPVGNEGREIAELATAFNDMLERIEALIADMRDVTDNIAHDLKSPLTRIRGIAETTLTGTQDISEYRDMSGNVIEECDRMVSMINTMLEIARTDAGLTKLNPVQINLNEILDDIIDIYGALAQDKGISLILLTSDKLPAISADKAMIQRAMANFVDNAVKYTPSGGSISISVESDDDKIVVSVCDTGPGIPETDLPHIFERFYRGEKSRSTPGSGLGLSLVMSVAKAHGGDVSVEGSGKGSKFHLVLPYAAIKITQK